MQLRSSVLDLPSFYGNLLKYIVDRNGLHLYARFEALMSEEDALIPIFSSHFHSEIAILILYINPKHFYAPSFLAPASLTITTAPLLLSHSLFFLSLHFYSLLFPSRWLLPLLSRLPLPSPTSRLFLLSFMREIMRSSCVAVVLDAPGSCYQSHHKAQMIRNT